MHRPLEAMVWGQKLVEIQKQEVRHIGIESLKKNVTAWENQATEDPRLSSSCKIKGNKLSELVKLFTLHVTFENKTHLIQIYLEMLCCWNWFLLLCSIANANQLTIQKRENILISAQICLRDAGTFIFVKTDGGIIQHPFWLLYVLCKENENKN